MSKLFKYYKIRHLTRLFQKQELIYLTSFEGFIGSVKIVFQYDQTNSTKNMWYATRHTTKIKKGTELIQTGQWYHSSYKQMPYVSQIVSLTNVKYIGSATKILHSNFTWDKYGMNGESNDTGYIHYRNLRGMVNSLLQPHNYQASTLPSCIC